MGIIPVSVILLFGTSLQSVGFDIIPGEQFGTHSGVLALDAVGWFYITEASIRQFSEGEHRWIHCFLLMPGTTECRSVPLPTGVIAQDSGNGYNDLW